MRFVRHLSLEAGTRAIDVDETAAFASDPARTQRAVAVSSLSVGAAETMTSERVLAPQPAAFAPLATLHVTSGHALGYYDVDTHELASVAWRAGDVEDAAILERRYSIVVRLTAAPERTTHTRYAYEFAATLADAQRLLAADDAAAQGAPDPARSN